MLKYGIFCGKSILENCNSGSLNLFGFIMKSITGGLTWNRSFHVSNCLSKKPGIIHPSGYSLDWAVKAAIPNIDKYTIEPLPKIKTGGRGPNGRMELKHIGGGLRRPEFMVSKFRGGLSNGSESVISEKILIIHKNWWRPEYIALVARGCEKRWIYATSDMKVGRIVNSHGKSSALVSKPTPGDAFSIACLPINTQICQIERYPGQGAHYAIKAGTHGLLLQKHTDNTCVVQIGKRLLKLSSACSAVVGQMSNVDHNKRRFTRFGQKRWLGIKQRSGLKQKKTGRFGRKIRKIRKPVDFTITPDFEIRAKLFYSKPGDPAAIKKPGTFENPVNIKPFPVEEDELHPKFKWCTWSRVR